MAASMASDRPDLAAAAADGVDDPFTSSTPAAQGHVRFSNFDQELFAAGPGSSPRQAKRALEAHLAETDRRLDEAGKLGTALVSQRKALAEQLQEVEKLQAEAELNPDLRRKLVEIEKDYNDLARESARVFLPKQRVPSNETNQGSPYMLDSRSGRRSVSPSKFESQATGSPTKLNVPNRKIRNQPGNRVHDIEFAAEISTSLIAQVRNLQALLAEREEQAKDHRNNVSRLEQDSEALQQRLKILDESEHRFKEENWNLQTRMQEMASQQRDASDREKKLDHALHAANAAKASTQKELDEAKLARSKLVEEHAAATKHHDIELGTAKRSMAMAEGERAAMQRKIDDLTGQNQELAKAVSAQRARTQDRDSASGLSDEDLDPAADNITPEHSPPPSPVKGTTPRHSMLETETLKTSLQHAQRTIQSQRSQLHREKTEKLELRRIIQDLRDDLEKARNDIDKAGAPIVRRGRKVEPKEFKKPPRLLGSFRSSRQEIVILDDPDWEDTQEISPRSSATRVGPTPQTTQQADGVELVESIESSDNFDTANEASDAFETANERATETEDFQTGNEDGLDSDGAATETGSRSRGFGRMKRPPSLQPALSRHGYRESFDSTASTSGDEDDFPEFRTPTAAASLRRYRVSRGPHSRSSRQVSEEPNLQASPAASFASDSTGTPAGQSLFAELQDFGSDDESIVYTPGRRSVRSMTPGSTRRAFSPPPAVPQLPKVIMVDSGAMTDPVDFATQEDLGNRRSRASLLSAGDAVTRSRSVESVVHASDFRASTIWRGADEGDFSRPMSTSYSDAGAQYDIDEKLAQFPVPPTSPPRVEPPSPPSLNLSLIQSEDIEPREEQQEPPAPLVISIPITVQDVEPVVEPEIPQPTLSLSTIVAEDLEPQAEPETPPPSLSMSTIFAEGLEPRAEPETPPPALTLSTIVAEDLEPKAEPETPPPVLSLSAIQTEGLEPRAEPEIPAPALTLSNIAAEDLEPRVELEIPAPALTLSNIVAEDLEPKAELEIPAPALTLSNIVAEDLEPKAELEIPAPALTLSNIVAEDLEPKAELEIPEPILSLSTIMAEGLEPKAEPPSPPPELTMTSILFEVVDPIVIPDSPELAATRAIVPVMPVMPDLSMSSIMAQNVEPVSEPEVVVLPPSLTLSPVQAEELEPKEEPEVVQPKPWLVYSDIATENVEPVPEPVQLPPQLAFSSILTEHTRPVHLPPALAFSPILTEHTLPIVELSPVPPTLVISSLSAEAVEPVSPPPDIGVVPHFAFSSIETIETRPIVPRTPKRDGFILPRDMHSPFIDKVTPEMSNNHVAPFVGRNESKDVSPLIAEDQTRQSPSGSAEAGTPESLQPFKELSSNSNAQPTRKQPVQTSDQSAQTSLTAGAINQLMKTGLRTRGKSPSISTVGSPDTIGTIRVYRSQENLDSPAPVHNKGKAIDAAPPETGHLRRPGSALSAQSSLADAPPLPSNHHQIIQAARSGSSGGPQSQSNMGPPVWPASAMKHRPHTPNQHRPMSPASAGRGTPTPRAAGRGGSSQGNVGFQSAAKASTAVSRQSSVSSFASELDARFNMRPNGMADATGFGPNTDPRMIQAITQTMIGEYLWKYTRKTGRGEMSEKRHRRYFWVHPYTRTLYWSDRDPSTAGRSEHKAKSVAIEAVRVVTDDNPMPPGLHRKSLVIISPGRTVKLTCTTGQRHETWFNALSYLLLRTGHDGQSDAEELAENITREDMDEFNPQYGRRPANGIRPSAPSLSSYNSRTTRNESQMEGIPMDIPTLNPSTKYATAAKKPSIGSLSSKLGGYLRSGGPKLSGTLSTIRGRTPSAQNIGIYEASEVHDSAEDLREMIERQDRESDRLENVRACCDGKHDVGTLPHTSRRSRAHHHHHHHAGHTVLNTPMATMRSRA